MKANPLLESFYFSTTKMHIPNSLSCRKKRPSLPSSWAQEQFCLENFLYREPLLPLIIPCPHRSTSSGLQCPSYQLEKTVLLTFLSFKPHVSLPLQLYCWVNVSAALLHADFFCQLQGRTLNPFGLIQNFRETFLWVSCTRHNTPMMISCCLIQWLLCI